MAAVKHQPKTPCPCCKTSERGDLYDYDLGGHVCNDCAKWGKIAEIQLRDKGLVGCVRKSNDRQAHGGAS